MKPGCKKVNNGLSQKLIKPEELDKFLKDNPNYRLGGLKASKSTKIKLSISHLGHKLTESQKRKQSEKMKGKLNPFFGRRHSKESIDKMKASIAKSMPYRKIRPFMSKPEKIIYSYLSNYFITKTQYRIKGYNHPYDIYVLLPNGIQLLLEFDGNYWHKDTDYKDDNREHIALFNGYAYMVIKESDYYNYNGLQFVKTIISNYYPEVETYQLKNATNIKLNNLNIKPIRYDKSVFFNICNNHQS